MFFKRLEDVTNRLRSSHEPRNEFSDVVDGQGMF